MGLLSKILGNVVSDAIGKAKEQMQEHNVDMEQVKKVFSAAKETENRQPQNQPQQQLYQQNGKWKDVFVGTEGHTKEHFRKILNSEFSQKYTIKEDVPVSEIGGNEGKNYDFALYENGILKGFVVPMTDYYNKYSKYDSGYCKNYRASRLCAEKANIPYIHFILSMPNKKDFVIDRINRLVLK